MVGGGARGKGGGGELHRRLDTWEQRSVFFFQTTKANVSNRHSLKQNERRCRINKQGNCRQETTNLFHIGTTLCLDLFLTKSITSVTDHDHWSIRTVFFLGHCSEGLTNCFQQES